jgi:hypothetical protein
MRPPLVLLRALGAVLFMIGATGPNTAHGAFPNEFALSGLSEHDDLPVLDTRILGASYREFVKELGTMIANKPLAPPTTTGMYGWEVAISNQFVFNEAKVRGDGEVSPWDRAHIDENAPHYQVIPMLSVRKGLPFSTEVGLNMGWIGNTRTGVVSGWGRVAILEHYRPSPDLTLQIGYAGYLGNDELEVSTLDLGVTLGATYHVGQLRGVNSAQIAPWANFSSLRVSAAPLVDEETIEEIGAVFFQRGTTEEGYQTPIVLPQFGLGMQVLSRGVFVRFSATWAPATIPILATGAGFKF